MKLVHAMENPHYVSALKKKLCRIIFSIPALCLALAIPQTGAGQTYELNAKEYLPHKAGILKLELAVNEAITSTFSGSFAVVNRPKGAYLPGYGISLSFLVNIHRAFINTPFGQVRSKDAVTPELKRQRIEEMKEKLVHVLEENVEGFRQLKAEDNVSIVAFIEDRNFPDEPSANRTIVLSILKKDLDELRNRNDRAREFKQRMRIVEY